MSKKKPYFVMKTGRDNLGPGLSWWVVLGPGMLRTHFVRRETAKEVADLCNIVFKQGQQADPLSTIKAELLKRLAGTQVWGGTHSHQQLAEIQRRLQRTISEGIVKGKLAKKNGWPW